MIKYIRGHLKAESNPIEMPHMPYIPHVITPKPHHNNSALALCRLLPPSFFNSFFLNHTTDTLWWECKRWNLRPFRLYALDYGKVEFKSSIHIVIRLTKLKLTILIDMCTSLPISKKKTCHQSLDKHPDRKGSKVLIGAGYEKLSVWVVHEVYYSIPKIWNLYWGCSN